MESGQPNEGSIGRGWIWWIILGGIILALSFFLFQSPGAPSVNIPYSTFLRQVRAGNVDEVRINGSSISGTFSEPYTPPAGEANAESGDGSGSSQSFTNFTTTYPEVVGDPNLIPLLEESGVQVNVTPPSSPIWGTLIAIGLPIIVLVGLMVWMSRRMGQQGQGDVFNFGRSKARRYTGVRTRVTFEDVAGADEAKQDLREVVDFLRNPGKYHQIGARIPRGILLVGPPGTGKTLLARAVAGEANAPFFSISASEFVEMFVGVGASRVRDLFEKAKSSAPAIIFIDELDAVGRRRGAGVGTVNDEREQTLNQLLNEMDGFDERHEVIVLAATNRPDVLDPAITRPGRFDREVVVGLPDLKGREEILRIHTRSLRLAPDVDLAVLARATTGFSGADLANLANEAALVAARNDHREVTRPDFEQALDKIMLGAEKPSLANEHERRVVAYHESGHALVAWFRPRADPVHKVTIIPHGRSLGVTAQLPEQDRQNYDKEYLLSRLDVMLAGRVSEEIALDDISTGAESDLVQATALARNMVARWGMGSLGPIAFKSDEQQPFLGYEMAQGRDYSEETAARIDKDVERLIAERYDSVRALVRERRDELDRLVNVLLDRETATQNELVEILGPRPRGEEAEPQPTEMPRPRTAGAM